MKNSLSSNRIFHLFRVATLALVTALSCHTASAASDSWTGGSGLWSSTNMWTTGTIAGAGDDVVFNVSGSNAAENVGLNATQSANSLTFNSTGGVLVLGSGTAVIAGTAHNLDVGAGGITVNAGSGMVQFGESNNTVLVTMAASFAVTNNSASLLQFRNAFEGQSGASDTLTLTGTGAGNINFSGNINDNGGTVAVVVDLLGTGVADLNSGYSGELTVQAGTAVGGVAALGGNSPTVLIGDTSGTQNATLDFNAGGAFNAALTEQAGNTGVNTVFVGSAVVITATNTVVLSNTSSNLLINGGSGASSITFSGNVSGAGGLTNSTDTLILGGSNTYSGGTTISSGVVELGNAFAVQNSTVTVNTNNGLKFSNLLSGTNTYNLAGLAGSGNLSLSDIASNAVSLNLTVNPSANYTGTLTLSGGTLSITGSSGSTGSVTQTSGSLALAANTSSTIILTDAGSDTATSLTTTANFTAPANGATLYLNLLNSGSGALTLGSTGSTTISTWAIVTGTNGATGFGKINSSHQLVQDTSTSELLSTSTSANIDYTTNPLSDAGTAPYTSGTLTMTGSNRALNSLFITSGSAGTLNLSGSTLAFTSNALGMSGSANYIITNGQLGASGGTLTIDSVATGTLFVNSLISSGTGGLVKAGSGLLIDSATNTYTGLTAVSGGTLRLGVTNVFLTTGTLTTTGVGTFDLAGNSQTLATVTNGGNITSSSGTGTLTAGNGSTGSGNFTGSMNVILNDGASASSFTGVFNNTGTITNSGAGAGATTISGAIGSNVTNITQSGSTSLLNLSGADTAAGGFGGAGATGTVTITSGTLQMGSATALGAPNVVSISTNGVLDLNGNAETIAGLNNGTGSGVVEDSGVASTLTLGGSNVYSFGGTLTNGSGTLALTVALTGTGSQTLTASNTYTGLTSVSAGTLQLGINNAINTANALTVNSGGTFDLAGYTQNIGSATNAVTNNGTITSSLASGTLNMISSAGGSGNFTGSMSVIWTNNTAGTNPISTGTWNNTGNITLDPNNTGTIKLEGVINNTGTITNSGTGTGEVVVGANGVIGNNVQSITESSSTSILALGGANSGAGGFATGTGSVIITSGTLQLSTTPSVLGAGNVVSIGANGLFDDNESGGAGNATIAGLNNINGAGGIVQTGFTNTLFLGGSNVYSFGGTLQNGAGGHIFGLAVALTGTGSQTLTGTNTYTGATTVSSGTLQLGSGGSMAGTAVTVGSSGSNATLLVAGNYTIGTSGTASLKLTGITGTLSTVDGTINVLTISGSSPGLTIGGKDNINLEVSGTMSDEIVSGTAGVTGTNTINLTALGLVSSGTDVLISAPGGITYTSGTFVLGGTTSGQYGASVLSLKETGTTVLLVDTANATPATAYFSGSLNSIWNTISGSGSNALVNFNTTATGGTNTYQLPGATTNVHFYATSANTSNLNTTLGQNFTINSLTVDGTSLGGENTPVSIGGTNSLTLMASGSNGNTVGNGITVGAGSGGLTISAPVVLGGSNTWTNNSSNTLTVSGNVSGFNALTTGGSGLTSLTGTNTYTGITTIQAGTLSINTVAAIGSAQSLGENSTVDLGAASVATLQYVGTTGTLAQNIAVSGAGTISNTGGGALTLSGTLTKNGSTLALTGSGSSSFVISGPIVGSSAGSDLDLALNTTITSASNAYNGPTVVYNGATLTSATTNIVTNSNLILGGTTSPYLTTSGTLNLDGFSQTFTGLSTSGSQGAADVVTNTATSGTATLAVGGGAGVSGTFSGVINDGSSHTALTVGGGTLTLTGSNTYTGATTVNSGTLSVARAGTVNSINGGTLGATAIIVTGGGTLLLSASNALGTSATVTLASGALVLSASQGSGGVSQGSGEQTSGGTFHGYTATSSPNNSLAISGSTTGGTPVSGVSATGVGTLTLTANSTIDFKNTPETLVFTGYNDGGNNLNVIDYSNTTAISSGFTSSGGAGDDRLIFDVGTAGLTTAQLDDISFSSNGTVGGFGAVEIQLGAGSTYWEVTAVPEPTTILAGLLVLGFLGLRERRRLSELYRRVAVKKA